MKTSFWAPYIPDSIVNAICWTLIHSLWVGMIIALLAGIVISLTRKSAAALRYRLLCGLLVLFVFSMAVTFLPSATIQIASSITQYAGVKRVWVRRKNCPTEATPTA